MNNADEQAAQDYYTLLGTYIRELHKAHKGIRRLMRRNRKLEAENKRLNQIVNDASAVAFGSQELNPSNYDHDDVCQLNSDMVEVVQILHEEAGRND